MREASGLILPGASGILALPRSVRGGRIAMRVKAKTGASNKHEVTLVDATMHLRGVADLVDELHEAITNQDGSNRTQLVREALVEKVVSQLAYVLDDIIGDKVQVPR